MSDQFPPPTGSPVEAVAPTAGTPKAIVWAFVLSLAGFLILTALAAVAMVITNWKQVQASGRGKGLAIAALIISGLWIVIMVFAVLSPSDGETDSAGAEVVEVVEDVVEPTPEPTPEPEAVPEVEVVDTPQSFIECVQTPYRTEYLRTASNLSREAADIISEGTSGDVEDLLLAIERLKNKGVEYDALGRAFKFADSCGDEKFGELNAELGDLTILLGQQMSAFDGAEMLATGDVSPVEEAILTLKRMTNQTSVLNDYLVSRES
jgi:hypothetical protein